MAVRIRMKKLGRTHRPFFRVCATDGRSPRDGRVIEELGTYDPMLPETDARAILNGERIDYWISVGAQPSDNVKTLIKKYGTNGSHLEAQQAALARLAVSKPIAPAPLVIKAPEPETPAEETPAEGSEDKATADTEVTAEAAAEPKASAEATEVPAAEATEAAADEVPAAEVAEEQTKEKAAKGSE